MLCPRCNKKMQMLGNFWFCVDDGVKINVYDANSSSFESNQNPSFESIIGTFPTPLACSIMELIVEENAYIALHRLTDSAEIITRFFSMILLSDILRQRGEFPEYVQNALADKIERPTFGAWKELLKISLDNLPKKKGKATCFVRELPAFIQKYFLPLLGRGDSEPSESIISLRNLIAHSSRLSESFSIQLLEVHKERFMNSLKFMGFLSEYDLVGCYKDKKLLLLKGVPADNCSFPEYKKEISYPVEKERVYLVKQDRALDLFPLQAFTQVMQLRDGVTSIGELAPQIYFRLNERNYLEFIPFSKDAITSHIKGSIYEKFKEIFSLEEWRERRRKIAEIGQYHKEVEEIISRLTDVLIGRDEHIKRIKNLIKKIEGGIIWISGNPGIGKSAIMARLVKEYIGQQHYFTFAYFFRYGQKGCSKIDFLTIALKELQVELKRRVEITIEGKEKAFSELLNELVRNSGKKVLFFIDGIDEIYLKDQNFLDLIQRTQGKGIIWVCAGRGLPNLEIEFNKMRAITAFEDGLPPLDESGVRAMLTEHLGRLKYNLFERDEPDGNNRFIEIVTRKSEGLPIYVRLVIEDLKEGKWNFNDEEKLPGNLTEYFENILERLRISDIGSILTPILCLLAWSREPVTLDMLKYLLRTHHLCNSSRWEEILNGAIDYGRLMLQVRPNSDGINGFAIYHESLREHILISNLVELNREWAKRRWLEVCETWQQNINSPEIHRYVLRYYPEYLFEAQEFDRLLYLIKNGTFIEAQRQFLSEEPDLILKTIQMGLKAAINIENVENMAELILMHAKLIENIYPPINKFEEGHLDAAVRLAKIIMKKEYKVGVLWLLFLAWECEKNSNREGAERCLKEILLFIERNNVINIIDDGLVFSLGINFISNLSNVGIANEVFRRLFKKEGDAILSNNLENIQTFDELNISEDSTGDVYVTSFDIEKLREKIEAFAPLEKAQYSAEILKEVKNLISEIEDLQVRSAIIKDISLEMASAGMFDEAEACAKEITSTLDRFEVLKEISDLAADMAIFEKAIRISEKIEDITKQCEALIEIARNLSRRGMISETKEVYKKILNLIGAETWEKSNIIIKLIKDLLKMKKQNEALNILNSLEHLDDYDFYEISKALLDIGNKEEAIKFAQKIKNKIFKEEALMEIYKEFFIEGEQSSFFRFVEEIEDLPVILNVMNNILKLYNDKEVDKNSEKFKKIWNCLKEKIKKNLDKDTLDSRSMIDIVELLVRLEFENEARAIINEMKESLAHDESFGQIAVVLASKGRKDEAWKIFEQLKVQVKNKERDSMFRTVDLINLAKMMSDAGFYNEAKKTIDEAKETAEAIEDSFERSIAFLGIAEYMINQKKFRSAIIMTEKISEPIYRSESLRAIVEGMAKEGKKEEAKKIIMKWWDDIQNEACYDELWEVVLAAAISGFTDLAVDYATRIPGHRSIGLIPVFDALVEKNEKRAFLDLLPLSCWSMITAFAASSSLIRFYPENADSIVRIIQSYIN